jgi:hypothetical protein
VADSYIGEEKEEVKALYKDGGIPESEDRVLLTSLWRLTE